MKIIVVSKNEAGQRFDKLLAKVLNQAPKSFIYKMLRKKNITLNGKKADGSEKVVLGDEVKIFLSDDTFEKFSTEVAKAQPELSGFTSQLGKRIPILYEDDNVLIVNKPAGVLSQKAAASDISMVEHVISYLLETKQITQNQLNTFKPGVCNRLDRNTSGIMVAGKSLAGLQTMAELFKDRSLHKYYRCIVKGKISNQQLIQGYLVKEEATNKVTIYQQPTEGAEYIETEYKPVLVTDEYTLLEVKLITGKTHQIRAHLKSIGHGIIGDGKYGSKPVNDYFRKTYGLNHQLLHAYRLEFPSFTGTCAKLSNQVYIAEIPKQFQEIQAGLF